MRDGAKIAFARQLRRHMTDAEQLLWRHLRRRQLAGYRFRRQHPVGPYIVDFACIECGLVIEVDGGQHQDSTTDRQREDALRRRGFEVLRFWNNDVLECIEGVCDVILRNIAEKRPCPGLPSQARQAAGPERAK